MNVVSQGEVTEVSQDLVPTEAETQDAPEPQAAEQAEAKVKFFYSLYRSAPWDGNEPLKGYARIPMLVGKPKGAAVRAQREAEKLASAMSGVGVKGSIYYRVFVTSDLVTLDGAKVDVCCSGGAVEIV